MPQAIRHTLLSIRDLLMSAGPFAVLAVALLVLTYLWLDPAPPRRVTLATGPAQSAYEQFGKRYRKALAANGIDVVLLSSQGSSDNLQLLRDGKADLGFVQGGSNERSTKEENGIVSLGSLFVEPIWLFYRERAAPKGGLTSLTQLKGLRLNVGTPGSGEPALMRKLFDANRIDPGEMTISQLGETPATMALLAGDVDAIVFASAPESLMVQMLLQTPGIRLMDLAQSEAYSRRFPFLTPVVLPRGVVDLSRDLPANDLRLVATTTELLAREHTHPALQQLFAQAAMDLHSAAGWFNRAGAFPTTQHSEYPVSREAQRTIAGGRPFLQRYLPFWLANLVERMWLALGVILALLLPLSRVVPPLYQFRIRSRVFRWYAQLRALELQMQADHADPQRIARELDALEQKVAAIHVPLSYADELYALRANIGLVRGKLAPPPGA